MDRISRPDVDKISGEYGGTEKTKNAGFSNKIDISTFPVGNYTLRVEQVSRDGEVLSKQERNFTIKQTEYKGIMAIDTVPSGKKYEVPGTEKLRVAGWAISNDKNAKIKLYINGACWIQDMNRVSRADVDKISGEYGGTGTTPKAGFDETIEIVNLPEGTHILTVEQVSSNGKVLSRADTTITIQREKFRGV